MNKQTAAKTGSRQALKAVTCGLVIAYAIMVVLSYDWSGWHALTWFADVSYKMQLMVAIAAMLLLGYIFGRPAGIAILIKKRNAYLTGIKYGFLTVWATTILSSLIGFMENFRADSEALYDYIYKPLWWVTIFGAIPIIIVGAWLGRSIVKQDAKSE